MSDERIWTAAVLVIGDEILSGRTQDKNVSQIATWLDVQGIRLREVRIVPDVEEEIVAALNAIRARYDYVFTTGGIGPTHDDITVDAVAKALGVGVIVHPDARATSDWCRKSARRPWHFSLGVSIRVRTYQERSSTASGLVLSCQRAKAR